MIAGALAVPLDEDADRVVMPAQRSPAVLTLVPPQPSVEPIIHTDALSKSFRLGVLRTTRVALTEVSLRVEPGEIYGLLGGNGAGKTTLLKLLLGLLRPTSGGGEVLGLPLGSPEARRRMGYVPEVTACPESLTPHEVLRYTADLHGMGARAARSAIERVVERLAIGAYQHARIRTLSKGLTQRVALAQAILSEPRLLILDEPMSGLDPVGRADVRELISELSREGVTILFSSHILPDVQSLCGRVALLSNGRLLHAGRPDDVIDTAHDVVEITVSRAGVTSVALSDLLEGVGADIAVRPGGSLVIVVARADVSSALRLLLAAGCDVSTVTPRGYALADALRSGTAVRDLEARA